MGTYIPTKLDEKAIQNVITTSYENDDILYACAN